LVFVGPFFRRPKKVMVVRRRRGEKEEEIGSRGLPVVRSKKWI
jgi:hypothetical protein